MFGFGKKRPETPETVPATQRPSAAPRGLFSRLKDGLARTRGQLGAGLSGLLSGGRKVDEALFEELETLLLTADVGVEATSRVIGRLRAAARRSGLTTQDDLIAALKAELRDILRPCQAEVQDPAPGRPQVILMVGVNGAGKTTTIGKLARRLQDEGNSVMLAAGDTFRAAAVEQLQTWGERNGVMVIAQRSGADSASVIFDALQSARAR